MEPSGIKSLLAFCYIISDGKQIPGNVWEDEFFLKSLKTSLRYEIGYKLIYRMKTSVLNFLLAFVIVSCNQPGCYENANDILNQNDENSISRMQCTLQFRECQCACA